ncbi:hypothetical protein GCM10009525_53800 [Streptosporangium amethystogenes subsp. fukuiense]
MFGRFMTISGRMSLSQPGAILAIGTPSPPPPTGSAPAGEAPRTAGTVPPGLAEQKAIKFRKPR